MHALDQIRLFAEQWHRGEWRARDLPGALGADVLWRAGGANVLGFAVTYRQHRAIVLNTRIRNTPAVGPLLYHEGAHIIQGDLLGFCGNAWAERQCERNATYGSALLAIPTASAVELVDWRASVREIADLFEVPRALVAMRGALAVLLGEATGDASAARAALARARRGLDTWMAWQARRLPETP